MSTTAIISPEDYLAREELAESRAEYVDGEIVLMTDASERHCLITGNVHFSVRSAVRASQFQTYVVDLKVRTARGSYRYPDVLVLQPPPQFSNDRTDVITNPLVILEVLSPATEAVDRGEKFADYRTLESLQAYVLVSQEKPCIECFTRQSDDSWNLVARSDGEIEIPPLDVSLPLPAVYENVTF